MGEEHPPFSSHVCCRVVVERLTRVPVAGAGQAQEGTPGSRGAEEEEVIVPYGGACCALRSTPLSHIITSFLHTQPGVQYAGVCSSAYRVYASRCDCQGRGGGGPAAGLLVPSAHGSTAGAPTADAMQRALSGVAAATSSSLSAALYPLPPPPCSVLVPSHLPLGPVLDALPLCPHAGRASTARGLEEGAGGQGAQAGLGRGSGAGAAASRPGGVEGALHESHATPAAAVTSPRLPATGPRGAQGAVPGVGNQAGHRRVGSLGTCGTCQHPHPLIRLTVHVQEEGVMGQAPLAPLGSPPTQGTRASSALQQPSEESDDEYYDSADLEGAGAVISVSRTPTTRTTRPTLPAPVLPTAQPMLPAAVLEAEERAWRSLCIDRGCVMAGRRLESDRQVGMDRYSFACTGVCASHGGRTSRERLERIMPWLRQHTGRTLESLRHHSVPARVLFHSPQTGKLRVLERCMPLALCSRGQGQGVEGQAHACVSWPTLANALLLTLALCPCCRLQGAHVLTACHRRRTEEEQELVLFSLLGREGAAWGSLMRTPDPMRACKDSVHQEARQILGELVKKEGSAWSVCYARAPPATQRRSEDWWGSYDRGGLLASTAAASYTSPARKAALLMPLAALVHEWCSPDGWLYITLKHET